MTLSPNMSSRWSSSRWAFQFQIVYIEITIFILVRTLSQIRYGIIFIAKRNQSAESYEYPYFQMDETVSFAPIWYSLWSSADLKPTMRCYLQLTLVPPSKREPLCGTRAHGRAGSSFMSRQIFEVQPPKSFRSSSPSRRLGVLVIGRSGRVSSVNLASNSCKQYTGITDSLTTMLD